MDRAVKRSKQYSAMKLQEHQFPLTIDQWIIFKRIVEEEGQNQIEIAESTYKDPASVTRILDLLRKKGLVRKHLDENDRRRYTLFPTEEGKQAYEGMLDIITEIRGVGVQGIPEEDLAQMEATLNRIYENFDQKMK